MAWRLQPVPDSVCLPADGPGTVPAWKVSVVMATGTLPLRDQPVWWFEWVGCDCLMWCHQWADVSWCNIIIVFHQGARGAELPQPRLQRQHHATEKRGEERGGAVAYCTLQEEMSQSECYWWCRCITVKDLVWKYLGHETDTVSWEYKNKDVLKVNKIENKAKLQCEWKFHWAGVK